MPRILQILLAVVLAGLILYIGRSLFIPLSFALLISFILYPVCKWMEKKGINGTLAIFINLIIVTAFLGSILFLLINQLNTFGTEWPLLENKLHESYRQFSAYLKTDWNISSEQQQIWLQQFSENSTTHLFGLLQQTISASVVSLVLLLLIPIYSFLILFYRVRLLKALIMILPDKYRTGIKEIVQLAIDSYYGFIKGMLIVYLIVGILNSLGLLLLGIPHAILFGCIAAILTFIPYVGIMVASLFPITLAWVTYNSIWYPVGVIAIFAIVQYLEANLIFPWAVARKLNLNTLMTIVAIIIGGILWGAAGMILFVPFAAILKLVAERVKGGEGLAVLLGDGKL
ncbi:AI-2E family transporter [Flavihumibacter fluvii]|uniref:AI-2E family transporter n=1 Tax=Flavihumibacter fluvii TaxID=2838157 RepID=UPI001BDE730C|nr:AI-2E family transporter [Flavihumibacter fluvii]ULQ53871.1 AI-2E family transporter [Flavihumibacter fluvii]